MAYVLKIDREGSKNITGTILKLKINKNKVATPKPKFSPIVAKNMQDPTGKYMWLFSGTK